MNGPLPQCVANKLQTAIKAGEMNDNIPSQKAILGTNTALSANTDEAQHRRRRGLFPMDRDCLTAHRREFGFRIDRTMQVSRCRFWVCDRCNSVFEKQDLSQRVQASQTTAPVFLMGTGTIECPVCHAVYQEGEVYHGSHDLPRMYWWELEAKSGQCVEMPVTPASLARQPSRSIVMKLPGIARFPDVPMTLPSPDAPESDWVDYLWSVRCDLSDPLSEFSMPELDAIARKLRSALEARLGQVRMHCETQDCTDFAHFAFEQRWLREADNAYPEVILSQIAKLVVVYLEWDFTAEALELIKIAIAEAGCVYVPFRLFAEPQHYPWQALSHQQFHPNVPASTTAEMKREYLWQCFFDYE